MRLWTVHPRYLDPPGLNAVWREGLLARAVLRGETRGYRNHPQLIRFRNHPVPLKAIDCYLKAILAESLRRDYNYGGDKIDITAQASQIEETRGQLEHEWKHLLAKLAKRAPALWKELHTITAPDSHPLFCIKVGEVREWEKAKLTEKT